MPYITISFNIHHPQNLNFHIINQIQVLNIYTAATKIRVIMLCDRTQTVPTEKLWSAVW